MSHGPKVNNSRQLANDLRRTHFTLGTAEPKHKSSEYVAEYTKKGAAWTTNQGDSLNLKASHFQLGNSNANAAKTFTTINQKDFKTHIGFQPPCLNEEKKRDLRSSHFTLGNYNPKYASLSHTDFPEKYIPYGIHKQEQEEQKQKMRKHNHDFTETRQKQFSSEYNNHFNKQHDPSMLKQGLTAQELMQKVVDLRKSHVILGEDFNPMQSIAQKDYQFKPGVVEKACNDNVAIRKTNFQLGVQGNDFGSVYSQYYVPHEPQKSELQQALIADLRASHFNLGQEPNGYGTTSGAYKGLPKGYKPVETLNPNLQKNHFNIGGDNPTAIPNKTTYSNFHRNFGNAVQSQARDQMQDRGSNWTLGGQKSNWESETQAHYKPMVDAKPADLEGSLKADLRSSHFKFNDVNPKSQYKSLQQASFVPKTAEPNKLDEALKKDLQANHFKLGLQPTPYQTSSGVTYQNHNGKAAALDPSLAQDLRANHFTYGNGQWNNHGATEYRSNYFWKEENQQAA